MSKKEWKLEGENESWIVLDGISTNMIKNMTQYPEICVFCECNWKRSHVVGGHLETETDFLNSLRFHYTYCVLARDE